MSLEVGTGKASTQNKLLEAFARGRRDVGYFCATFLGVIPHKEQLDWLENANATINVLATANRWGKTFVTPARHFHKCIYKLGAEKRYVFEVDGKPVVDPIKFRRTKYHTVHTGGEWETAALVEQDARKIHAESGFLQGLVSSFPASKPPHCDFASKARWKFRTLGHDASGIDGNSFYHISIDEAGWIADLDEKMRNVIRVRVADVGGTIDIVGTFKPGVSKDFYKYARRAANYTGKSISFDHQEDTTESGEGLDAAIKKYLKEYGIDLDEYDDAATREAELV